MEFMDAGLVVAKTAPTWGPPSVAAMGTAMM